MSYSPTLNWASIFTGGGAPGAIMGMGAPPAPIAALRASSSPLSRIGFGHGSCSQYSTRRGAVSASTWSNTARSSVLTFSFWSTTGTGMTIAKSCGGPW